MNRQQHDEYVQAILGAEEQFDNLDLSNLTLSKAEIKAIAENIPQSTLDAVEEIVESYQPKSGVDIRYLFVMKFLAILATKAMKPIKHAYDVGYNSP